MILISQKIRAFIAVVDHGTVHAAAQHLHLTQTAVTRRLAGLEEELGATLFIRSRRGMELTDAGTALLSYARQVVDLEGETLAKITGEQGLTPVAIRICGSSSILRARIIPAVTKAVQTSPHITFNFQLSDVESGIRALKLGQADFVVLEPEQVADEFTSKKLQAERYILVGPANWKNRPLADILTKERIIDFAPTDQMTFRLLAAHGLRDMVRNDRHFVNNTDALAALVADGLGYSVLTREFAENLIANGALSPIGGRRYLDFPIALAWYPRKHLPDSFRAIISACK
jgi:DNA-binding transcriptional LysR family regulator